MNENEYDPLEELEETKKQMSMGIAAQKNLIKNYKSNKRALEKLPLELHPDKPKKIEEADENILAAENKLIELETDLKELTRTRDDETEEKIQAALFEVEKFLDRQNTCAFIIKDSEFVFIEDFSMTKSKQNVLLEKYTRGQFVQWLAMKCNLKTWHLPEHRVVDLFNNKARTFSMIRYSVDNQRWNNSVYLPIKYMEQFFIDKSPVDTELENNIDYFEMLMHSLSGGKKENQDHIEQWILHKVINYDKAISTPDLVVVGHVGGNGKGIIQAIIRLMFPAMLSGKANAKTLNGNFNAIMLGKLIVFFDDQNSKEIPLEVVKQLAGSESMIFEEKGKDQYEGEKTHSSAWFSNELPFKLTPAGKEGGVDRRFSIMRTNITFLESIQKHFAKGGTELSIEESKDFAETIVSKVLLDRMCIAQWFQHLKQKHPHVTRDFTLKALHKEDYEYFLSQQKDYVQEIFDDLIKPQITSGKCVPLFVVNELLRIAGERSLGPKWVMKKLNTHASQCGINIVSERRRINIVDEKHRTNYQCTIIRPKRDADLIDEEFDWTMISKQPFARPAKGENYVNDSDLVFGVRNSSNDDIVDDVGEAETTEVKTTDADIPYVAPETDFEVKSFLEARRAIIQQVESKKIRNQND